MNDIFSIVETVSIVGYERLRVPPLRLTRDTEPSATGPPYQAPWCAPHPPMCGVCVV